MKDRPYTAADHQRYREAVAAEEKRELDRRREETKEAARKAWVADGGSPQSFERAWDALEEDRRKKALQTAADAAHAHQRQYSRI